MHRAFIGKRHDLIVSLAEPTRLNRRAFFTLLFLAQPRSPLGRGGLFGFSAWIREVGPARGREVGALRGPCLPGRYCRRPHGRRVGLTPRPWGELRIALSSKSGSSPVGSGVIAGAGVRSPLFALRGAILVLQPLVVARRSIAVTRCVCFETSTSG